MNKKWEYEIQDVPKGGQATDVLNKLSEQGWELIHVIGDRYYFKREKPG